MKNADRLLLGRGWCLDRTQYQLFDDKAQSEELTTGEFDILLALARHAGRPLSRDQLLDHMSGRGEDAFDRAVDVHVSRLRQKLGDDARRSELLKTVRGIGYMLVLPPGDERQ